MLIEIDDRTLDRLFFDLNIEPLKVIDKNISHSPKPKIIGFRFKTKKLRLTETKELSIDDYLISLKIFSFCKEEKSFLVDI